MLSTSDLNAPPRAALNRMFMELQGITVHLVALTVIQVYVLGEKNRTNWKGERSCLLEN